jgi:hypothetical protein
MTSLDAPFSEPCSGVTCIRYACPSTLSRTLQVSPGKDFKMSAWCVSPVLIYKIINKFKASQPGVICTSIFDYDCSPTPHDLQLVRMTTVFHFLLSGLSVADLNAIEFEESRVRFCDRESNYSLTCALGCDLRTEGASSITYIPVW